MTIPRILCVLAVVFRVAANPVFLEPSGRDVENATSQIPTITKVRTTIVTTRRTFTATIPSTIYPARVTSAAVLPCTTRVNEIIFSTVHVSDTNTEGWHLSTVPQSPFRSTVILNYTTTLTLRDSTVWVLFPTVTATTPYTVNTTVCHETLVWEWVTDGDTTTTEMLTFYKYKAQVELTTCEVCSWGPSTPSSPLPVTYTSAGFSNTPTAALSPPLRHRQAPSSPVSLSSISSGTFVTRTTTEHFTRTYITTSIRTITPEETPTYWYTDCVNIPTFYRGIPGSISHRMEDCGTDSVGRRTANPVTYTYS
jgi:hypothetical protein